MKNISLKQLIREIIEEVAGGPTYVLYFASTDRDPTEKLEDAKKFGTLRDTIRFVDLKAGPNYTEDKLAGNLSGITDYRWDTSYGHCRMIVCPVEKLSLLTSDRTHDLPDIAPGDLDFLSSGKGSLHEMYTHGFRIGSNGQKVHLSGSPVFAVSKKHSGQLRKYVLDFSAIHAGEVEKYEGVVVWANNLNDAAATVAERLGPSDKVDTQSIRAISMKPVTPEDTKRMRGYEDSMRQYVDRTPNSGD